MAKKSKDNNLVIEKKGTKLTITIDLSKTIGESKSGKNVLVASTGGNVDVGDDVKLGLNAYKKK